MTGVESASDYNQNVELFREREYPMLKDAIYLDHAGTTLYSKSLMERFAADMISNLYGNPHSASVSSQLSTRRIDDVRLRVLRFFRADPDDFEVIFVANATAGIKLVMDAFRSNDEGFIYGYHRYAHTSVVGVREAAIASRCLTDEDVENWLSGSDSIVDKSSEGQLGLFAYPAQSNMDGRRLPLSWCSRLRDSRSPQSRNIFSLLDAAALVSTAPLDLSNANTAPDFTVLSFYKIFGFPDLGALIVRKSSGHTLRKRRYFGGGTVDVVVCVKEQWHAPKEQNLYESIEDGTLPVHSIIALETAMKTHEELYESMGKIARHTSYLARKLFNGLKMIRHSNGEPVCRIYAAEPGFGDNNQSQGPVVAFNLQNSYGAWMSNIEVEKLASIRKIHIRSGGLCNPGGLAAALDLQSWEMRRNFSAGYRCGNEHDIMRGKPTSILRASLGAMSTIQDVEKFIAFIEEFHVESKPLQLTSTPVKEISLCVESLTVYPIKSCGGFEISPDTEWEVRNEGLAWDREWCLLHQGTGQALSQKRFPRMALIRPTLDFESGLLRVKYHGELPQGLPKEVSVPLSADPTYYKSLQKGSSRSSRVCGDAITALTYSSPTINDFFTQVIDAPCTLARFPAGGSGARTRHSKAHMQRHQQGKPFVFKKGRRQEASLKLPTPPDSENESPRPILLSNESPILAINRSSVNALNQQILKTGGKPASASVFRANIIIAPTNVDEEQKPYSEDHWSSLRIGQQEFKMLGSCRRCHMICVDQETAVKDSEPFVTLAKTRRFEGKVFFGSHMCHVPIVGPTKERQYPTIRVGDLVAVGYGDE